MYKLLLFSVFLAPLIFEIQALTLIQKKVVQFAKFESNYVFENETLPLRFTNISLIPENTRRTLVNANIVITEDLGSIGLIVEAIKCKVRDAPDTCINFKTFVFKNACSVLKAKKQLWTTLFAPIEPSFSCPLKKGHYILTNGYFDAEHIPPIDISAYYKLKCYFIDPVTEKKVGHLYVELNVVSMKKV